jgi:predicted nucleotidyltransferase
VSENALVQEVADVARALDGLLDRVVFIGGAIAPLLQVEQSFPAPRPTDDVDAIVVTTSYPDFDRVRERMRSLGFREDAGAWHLHRWITPGRARIRFDLVPAREHLGSSGSPWDVFAVETAVKSEVAEGLIIRHASGPGFLALKLAAFRDRGISDPQVSTDLEDIFALTAARPLIVDEVRQESDALQEFVAAEVSAILALEDFEDLLVGHLANVARASAGQVIPAAELRLRKLARVQQT